MLHLAIGNPIQPIGEKSRPLISRALTSGISNLRVTGISSADYDFGGTTELQILMSDSPSGFTLSKGAVTVSEAGSTETFTAVLNSIPTTDVVLNVFSDDTSEAVVQPTRLVFNQTNWDVPQTVSVMGVDDSIADGDQFGSITVSIDDALSNDAFDSVANQSVAVTTTDNESTAAAIVLSKTTASVTESGTTDSVGVSLIAAPQSDVVLTVSSANEFEVKVTPTTLTFTPDNWNVAQSVVLTSFNDFLRDGDQSTLVNFSVDDALSDDAFDARKTLVF